MIKDRISLSEIREQLGYIGFDNAPREERRPLIERAVARAQGEHQNALNAEVEARSYAHADSGDPCDDHEGELPW